MRRGRRSAVELLAVVAALAICGCGGGGSSSRPVVGYTSPPGSIATNWPVVTFQPSGVAGAEQIELWRDGAFEAVLPIVERQPPSHTWIATDLPDGTYTFHFRVRFSDGWVESAPVTVTLDRVVPALVETSPARGATVPGPVKEVRLTFSEPLRANIVKPAGFLVRAMPSGTPVPHTAFLSTQDPRVVTLTLSPLVAAPGSVEVAITGGAIDLAGNEIARTQSAADTFQFSVTSPWSLVGDGQLNSQWGGTWNATLFEGPGGALHAVAGDYETSSLRLEGGTWQPVTSGWPTGLFYPTYASDGATIWTTELSYGQIASVHRWVGTAWETVGDKLVGDPAATIEIAPLLTFDANGPVVAWNEHVGELAPGTVTTPRFARWNGAAWAPLTLPGDLAKSPVLSMRGAIHGAYALLYDTATQGRRTILARVRASALEFVAYLPVWHWSPSLALDRTGAVYIAENTGAQLDLFRWTGFDWEPLGAAVQWNGNVQSEYSFAVGSAGPVVAWTDAAERGGPRQLRVATRQGTLWVEHGGVLNTSMIYDARTPSVAFDQAGKPFVIWTEVLSGEMGSISNPLKLGVFVKTLGP